MNIALSGYGKMGRMIHSIAVANGHEVVAIIDPVAEGATARTINAESLNGADVVIEFSTPASAVANIKAVIEAGVPIVVGTTGWLDSLAEVEALVKEKGGRLMHSGNFSIGVAIFLSLVERAGQLINHFDSYDVSLHEVHHNQKADAPSGTALMAADRLLATIDRKTKLQLGNGEGRIDPAAINVSSSRVGHVPGIHTVMLDSSADTIEITHSARSREGFASGAVRAAAWLAGKKSGIYTMNDMLSEL